jgi:hypothetical protein
MSDNWHGWFRVEGDNISDVWREVFLKLMSPNIDYISPLFVEIWVNTLLGQSNDKDSVRDCLDHTYAQLSIKNSVSTVANTIFPISLWDMNSDRNNLYQRFLTIWPIVQKDIRNKNGHYFQRMIAYRKGDTAEPFNQLEHVIETYNRGNHRKSALQVSIMDPQLDHTHERQRGFPCLQHVNFIPHPSKKELDIVGYYTNQYIFEKAYGNYLGLYRLGTFMAHEMGLNLSRVMCIASCAKLADWKKYKKADLKDLEVEFHD